MGDVRMRYVIIVLERTGESVLYPPDETAYRRLIEHNAKMCRCTTTLEYVSPEDKRIPPTTMAVMEHLEKVST